MTLKVYRDLPLNVGTETDLVDLFTGDGSTTEVEVTNKTGERVGATITYDDTQVNKYNGGFTVDGETVTFTTAPPDGAEGVIPGISNIVIGILFDTDDVEGVDNPRVNETPFWLGDPDTIHLYEYEEFSGESGIELSIVDNISAFGAAISWCELACADSTVLGSPLTYQVSGTPLYTGPINTFDTLMVSAAAGAESIFCAAASDFVLGDYIKIGSGLATQEIVKIIGYESPYELQITPTTFDHDEGETVYACARKFWIRTTVPENAVEGEAVNLYDLALKRRYLMLSRL